MIQSESEGLRTKGAHGVNLSPRAKEDAVSQLKLVRWDKSGEFLFLYLLFLFRSLADFMVLTHIGEGSLLCQVH